MEWSEIFRITAATSMDPMYPGNVSPTLVKNLLTSVPSPMATKISPKASMKFSAVMTRGAFSSMLRAFSRDSASSSCVLWRWYFSSSR